MPSSSRGVPEARVAAHRRRGSGRAGGSGAALGVTDRLHILGIVTDVVALLPAADVLAAPSRNEGMGRVLVEAMALGMPVVGPWWAASAT